MMFEAKSPQTLPSKSLLDCSTESFSRLTKRLTAFQIFSLQNLFVPLYHPDALCAICEFQFFRFEELKMFKVRNQLDRSLRGSAKKEFKILKTNFKEKSLSLFDDICLS